LPQKPERRASARACEEVTGEYAAREDTGELQGGIGAAGNLTTGAVIAALALEYQAELHSNDTDFMRFSGLRWINLLE
jgi:predicted nucleic acid-binding protein